MNETRKSEKEGGRSRRNTNNEENNIEVGLNRYFHTVSVGRCNEAINRIFEQFALFANVVCSMVFDARYRELERL